MKTKTKQFERTLKALANHRRLAIVQYLKKEGESSVSEIAEAINLSLKATSKHLSILSAVDILEREQKSLHMFYRIADNQNSITKHVISLL